MSRPVQIVVTLVIFTAVMVGLNAALRPVIGSLVDWSAAQIGIGGAWAVFLVLTVPPGLWCYWQLYREGRAARTRSD